VELLGGPRADVRREIRLGADEPAQAQELVRAELVALHRVTSLGHAGFPVVVAARPLAGRADAVAPVVAVGEAAPGPAEVRGADALHVVHELLPDAAEVGDPRIGADPDAVVDDTAEVLDEVAVDVRVDDRPRLRRVDLDLGVRGEQRAKAHERGNPGHGNGLEKVTSMDDHGHSYLLHARPRMPADHSR
jgi:hypothetical protein